MNYQPTNYSELGRLIPSASKRSKSRQRFQLASLKHIAARCSRFAFSNEPRIQEVVDAAGKTQWKIYDPDTDRTFQLGSAPEVTLWLEQRYYNRSIRNWE